MLIYGSFPEDFQGVEALKKGLTVLAMGISFFSL